MPNPDILNRSVTKNDYAESPQGGAFFFAVGNWSRYGSLLPSINGLSARETDYILTSTLDQEAMWAGAVSIALTKLSSMAWEVDGDIPLRVKHGQELMRYADADRGWVSFISKILQDFLLTNNGAFVEIVRATTSSSSKIIGLIPLDSLRCTRTGNADTPVTYLDLKNRTHELQANEVLTFADMPSNRASMLGSGKCAAARAYQAIYKLASIESYLADKVSGRRPLAVHLINGLNDIQLRSVLQTAQSEADARGAISYMGAIMATIPGETPPSVATVPLADFPDNFDRQKETDISILTYANNLGIDVQDVQPLTGRALGTGAQSETLDEKAKGKGLAAFRQQFQHAMTTWVMEDGVEFNFIESDWRDQEKRASVYGKVGAMVSDSVKNGILTPAQGLQALVDEDIYPKEFLPVDATPDTTLSDTEKIEEPNAEQVAAVPAAPAAPVQVVPPKPLSIPKEMTTTQVELKESQPIQPGTMRVIIKRREGPAHKEAPANSAMMPLLLAAALMNNGEQMKGEDYMNLSEWIASLGKPVTKEKKAEQVKGVEAVMSEDGTSLTILMPADFFSQKQDEKPQDIVINIPAPIVNITNAPPVFNMPAPVINMAPQKAPQVTINPRIEVMMPDPKPAEFEVRRDNYGNVLGIQEKAT